VSPFDAATAVTAVGPQQYAWTVPDGWQVGRGAWGGLVVGALIRAVVATEPDPNRTVRSVTLQLVAPAMTGRHRIQVDPVRIGSAMSTWSAALSGDDGSAVAAMSAILGSARTSDPDHDHARWGTATRPVAPAAVDVDPAPTGPPLPVFTQHMAMRPVKGLPMSGGPAETVGWVDYAIPGPATAASLIALVDGWWPASLPLLSRMPRIATVNFTANLLIDPRSLAEGEPLLFHSFVAAADDGFTSEHRRLWTTDGRLAVDNLQAIVVGS